MKKILVALAVLLMSSAGVVWAQARTIETPIGDVPDLTPQMTIRAPVAHVRPGEPIQVVVEFKNFHADPAARCGPAGACLGSLPNTVTGPEGATVNVGHVHVYITRSVAAVEGPAQAVSFCIPGVVEEVNFAGTLSGNCPAITERGVYRVSAEFQSNSHVSSLKADNSPQHIPTSDVAFIFVR